MERHAAPWRLERRAAAWLACTSAQAGVAACGQPWCPAMPWCPALLLRACAASSTTIRCSWRVQPAAATRARESHSTRPSAPPAAEKSCTSGLAMPPTYSTTFVSSRSAATGPPAGAGNTLRRAGRADGAHWRQRELECELESDGRHWGVQAGSEIGWAGAPHKGEVDAAATAAAGPVQVVQAAAGVVGVSHQLPVLKSVQAPLVGLHCEGLEVGVRRGRLGVPGGGSAASDRGWRANHEQQGGRECKATDRRQRWVRVRQVAVRRYPDTTVVPDCKRPRRQTIVGRARVLGACWAARLFAGQLRIPHTLSRPGSPALPSHGAGVSAAPQATRASTPQLQAMAEAQAEPQADWESSKENFQPLKTGRKATALKDTTAELRTAAIEDRRR